MKPIAVNALVAVLAASGGVMAAGWFIAGSESESDALNRDEVVELQQRVESLEFALAALQSDRSPAATPLRSSEAVQREVVSNPVQAADTAPAVDAAAAGDRAESRRLRREQQAREKLLQAGWTAAEVDELYRKRDIATLDMMEQNHLAQREMIEKYPELARWRSAQSPMRQSMSDEQYVSYLAATGRPTSARVGRLLPGSPGEAAGLKEGDRIVRYGDQRVFGGGELEYATLQGKYGEPVTVEVERDGATFIMTLPRGPIGVSSFRYRD